MTLHEISEAANIVQEAADPEANIIFGTVIDRGHQGHIKVTVIATGFSREQSAHAAVQPRPAAAPPPQQRERLPRRDGTSPDSPGRPVPDARYMRREGSVELDASDEGFTPNFSGKLRHDLDVPAFLRKQLD
jgi:cell division protein FtsZ